VHASLWSKDGGRNLFQDEKGELGLSRTGYHFIGGIMHSAEALCAIANPVVNSYKRINAPPTLSGATWAPNAVTYAGNNRTHLIRIPDAGRFELRLADGAANPYLLQAAVLAAGLDGIRNARDPGQRLDINMYTDGYKAENAKRLPLNLLDALRALETFESCISLCHVNALTPSLSPSSGRGSRLSPRQHRYLMSCGLKARGWVMSCGLLLPERSWGLFGLK
jgi:glutamine synthetase